MQSPIASLGAAPSHLAKAAIAGAAISLVTLTACGASESASDYPTEPITFIVPYAPGASADLLAREYAEALGKELGVSVVVENREGGSGTIGTNAIVGADADGYTIGYGHNSPLAIQVLSNEDLPYATPEDYSTIGGIGSQPGTLAVRTNSPWATLEDFVEDARENPGERTIAVGAAGNVKDLQLREFEGVAEVDFNITPFSGGGSEAVTAALGGQVDAVSVNPSSISGLVESNDLRVLTVFTAGEFDQFETETIGDAGYEDVQILQDSTGVIAPAGLPEEVSQTLQEAHATVIGSDELKEILAAQSYVYEPMSGQEYAEAISADLEAFGGLLEETR